MNDLPNSFSARFFFRGAGATRPVRLTILAIALLGIATLAATALALGSSGTASAQSNSYEITVSPSTNVEVQEGENSKLVLTLSRPTPEVPAIAWGHVAVKTMDGTALKGSDFGDISLSRSKQGATTTMDLVSYSNGTIEVPVTWDYAVEGDETFKVKLDILDDPKDPLNDYYNLRFPGNNTSLTIDVTITERDKYEVSLAPGGTLTEGETDHNNVRTERSGQGTVRARIGVADSTASAADFDKWAPFNLRLKAFDPSAAIRMIRVETKDDTLVEATETIILELSNPTGNLTLPDLDGDGKPDEAIYSTWVIQDNETPLFAEMPDVTVMEGGQAQVTLNLERELLAGETVQFYVNVVGHQFGKAQPCGIERDDYAQPNVDYMTAEYTEYMMTGGEQSLTFTVPTASDPLHEADECFYIRAFATSGLQFRTQTSQQIQGGNRILFTKVTIEEDDPKPHLTFGSPEVVEPDPHPYSDVDPTAVDPTATLRYPVSLSNPSGVEVTVDYRDGSPVDPETDATGGVDYTAITPGTLTFMPGEVRRYVDVEVLADWLEEPDEQVYLEFSDADEACLIPGDDCQPQSGAVTVAGTILNNDRNLKITLAPDDDRVREGEPIVFRARLSHPIDSEVRITSEPYGGTATPDEDFHHDFLIINPELKIFPGTTEAVLTVATLEDDTSGEGLETVTLPNLRVELWRKDGQIQETDKVCEGVFGVPCTSSNVQYSIPPIPTPTGYILDGPVINLTAEREDVAEGNSVNFTVALSEPVAQEVTFTIKSQDGADDATGAAVAVAGSDYAALSPLQVTIPLGQTDGGTYPVAVLQDQVDEPDQAFTVLLESATGAPVDVGAAVVTVRDDDPRPELSIGDAQANEGDALEFVIALSQASERAITVNYVTEDDTATQGADYQGIERFESVTFAPGETSKTITVNSLMDNEPEIDETFRVELVDDPDARFMDATAVGTINDDDGTVISIADAEPVTETEGATPSATFTITLTPAQSAPVAVQWQTMDGLGAEHSVAKGGGLTISGERDYTPVTSGSVTFAPGEMVKQVSTTVLDDSEAEADESFRAVISVSDPNIMVLRSTAFAFIEDDDAWNIWLDENNAAWVEEGDTDKRITLKVQRTNASAEEAPKEARFHTSYSYITCFISEVKEAWPFTRIPNPYDYVSTATVAASGWDVRKYYSGDTQLKYPQCHLRGDGSSFNVDTFEKLSYTLPLEFEIRGDSTAEENETFTLLLESSLFGPNGRRFDPVSRGFKYITVTIVDDDTPQASVKGLTVGEGDGSADVTVSLSMESTQQEKVRVSMEPGTAQPWEDYTPLFSHDVTFQAGETTKTVSIPIVNDGIREEDEEFTVTLSNESDGINIHPDGETATVTITDDEADYLPRLTVPDRVVDEGDDATLLFRMNPPPPNRFWAGNIQWNDDKEPTSLPAATEGGDYAEITGDKDDAVSIGYGHIVLEQTEFTKTLSTVEDTLIEGGEYVGISTKWNNSLGNPIVLAKPSALVGIRDDDAGSVTIAPIAAATVEENQAWTGTAALTDASNPLGDVSWSVAGDDAAFFSIDQDTGVLTVSARNYEDPLDHDGDNVYQARVFAVDEDGNVDSADVQVTVTDVTYARFTVLIDFCCHADPSKRVYGAEEGDGIQVQVYPRFTTSTPVSLKWTTAEDTTGGNPAATTDYTPATSPTKLSWPAGDAGTTGTAQTFTIATTEDQLFEADETLLLRFTEGMAGDTDDVKLVFGSAPPGSVRQDGNKADATLTIGNDDAAVNMVNLSVNPASVGEGDGATKVTVTATPAGSAVFTQGGSLTVKVGKSGDNAVSGTDYAAINDVTILLVAGTSTASAQFTLTPTQDNQTEGDETITVHGTAAGLTVADASLTITDDDLPVPVLTIGDGNAAAPGTTVTVNEGEAAEFTVTATPLPYRDVTVQVVTGDDNSLNANQATANTDYTALTQTITIPAGSPSATVQVQTTQDNFTEGDESFIVFLRSPTNATIGKQGPATGIITDDDISTPYASLSVSPASVDEGAGATTVTVTAAFNGGAALQANQTIAVKVGHGRDGAVSGTDYAPVTSFDLTIPAGQNSAQKTFTLTPVQDELDEDNETLTVHGTSPGLTVYSVSVSIADDDAEPELFIGDFSAVEGDKAHFNITLKPVSGRDVTVEWSTSDDNGLNANQATADTDYEAVTTAQTVTIRAGNSVAHLDLRMTQDTVVEGDETFLVTLASPANATLLKPTARATITDDDISDPYATLSVSPASVSESTYEATVAVTATLSGGKTLTVDKTITVKVGIGGDSAVWGEDYVPLSDNFSITIPAGQNSGQKTFILWPKHDSLNEDTETLTIHGTAPELTVKSASLSITDDDPLPTLTIGNTSIAEGGKAFFTIFLTPASGRDVTFQWTTGDDNGLNANPATAGADYEAVTSAQTVTIPAGNTYTGIDLRTKQDSLVEGDETFLVTLASPTNAVLGSPSVGRGTITDDDISSPFVSLSLNPASATESTPVVSATVTATLSGSGTFPTDKTIRVKVGLGGDSAVSGEDYAPVDGFDLTIPAGQSSGQHTFILWPKEDSLNEDTETITVHGTSPGLTIYKASLSIIDDDPLPALSIGDVSIAEGGKAFFAISLTPASGREVTVQWTTGDDNSLNANRATAETDYESATTAQTLTFRPGLTYRGIDLRTRQDSLIEGDESFLVTLASPTNAALGKAAARTTIVDDDISDPFATLSVNPASVAEGAGATTVAVTATLSGGKTFPTDKTLSVKVGLGGDGAVSGTDYAAVSSFNLTIPSGQSSGQSSFTLTPIQDALDEDNETLTLHGTSAELTVKSASLTITDDDALPVLTIGDASVSEGETAEFTVTLNPVSGRDVTVQWTTGDDPVQGANQATADTDYTAVTTAQTATIAAGSTNAAIKVFTAQDRAVESGETFVVNLASPTNATLGSPSVGTGTITDNDGTLPPEGRIGITPVSGAIVPDPDNPTRVPENIATAPTYNFAVTLNGPASPTDRQITVKVGKTADPAISGTDYTAVSDFTITIAAGAVSGSGQFTFDPIDDALDEDDETVTAYAELAGVEVATATLTITDDDPEPVITIGNATADEGGKAQFTVTLDAVSGRDVTVQWTTGDDPAQGANQATADTDYTAVTTAQTATVAAGSTTTTIEVQTAQDTAVENNETFIVTLASPTNATLGSPSTGTATITDDDTAATTASLSVSPASVGEGDEATTVTVTATLDGSTTFAADKTVTFTVGKAGDSAEATTDYTTVITSNTITITAGQSSGHTTFTLTPTQDTGNEGDEAITLSATAPGLTVSDAALTIRDDDQRKGNDGTLPVISIDGPDVTEPDTSQAIQMLFTVALDETSSQEITVAYADAATGTATSGTDYMAITAGTLTFAPGESSKTVPVNVTGDALEEGDETVVLRLSSPTNAALSGDGATLDGTGKIWDNDGAYANRPRVSISADYSMLQGGDAWFEIRLSKPLSRDVHIPVDVVYITAEDDQKCSRNSLLCNSVNPSVQTLEEVSPHRTLLSPYPEDGDGNQSPREMYAKAPLNGSYIINPARPWYQTMRTGHTQVRWDTEIRNSIYVRQDGDGQNERFRIVLDTDHPLWPSDLVPAEYSGYAEVLVVDRLNHPAASRWWAELSADERRRMLSGGHFVRKIQSDQTISQAITSSYEGLNYAFKARVGALAGELSNAEGVNELTDAGLRPLDLTSPDKWWDSMDCRLRRVAVGDGTTDDPTSRWCQNEAAELGSAGMDRVLGIFEAVTLETADEQGQRQSQDGTLTGPEISIFSYVDATEGDLASFTIIATPPPLTDLEVGVTVSTTGDFGVAAGSQTVTISALGLGFLDLPTTGDANDEADGSVTATVNAGQGYTVSATNGTATVVVADDDDPPQTCTPNLPSDAITVSEVETWRGEYSQDSHVSRWNRVLAALGEDTGEAAMTADQAREIKSRIDNTRWDRTVRTLDALEQCAAPPPEVSITAGAGITEGGNASFTLTANPAPTAALSISVAVSQSGDFGVAAGPQTVSIPTTGSATLTVATGDDSVGEADGSVTATVNAGTDYTVSGTAGAATVAVADDDDPPQTCTPNLPSDAITASEVKTWRGEYSHDDHVSRWNRVLAALGEDSGEAPMTADQAREIKSRIDNTRWDRTVRTLDALEQCAGSTGATDDTTPAATPEISVTAGSGITEGGNASFTVIASPAPAAALDVTVAVTQSGDFGVTPGSQTVTIPTTGSATLTVATSDDGVDEADGSVTVTVSSGTGYTVSATAGTATVAVADDDDPPPAPATCDTADAEQKARAAFDWHSNNNGPDEGLFWRILNTLGADNLPAKPADVTDETVTAQYVEDYSDGKPWGGWEAIVDTLKCVEGDGSAQQDNQQDATPEISIVSNGDITEGGNAGFTVTANPAPASALSVSVSVTQSGDYGVTPGSQTVTIPTTGSATLTIATSDDNVDEADGSVTATVNTGTEYTVSATAGTATVAVADDDVPEISIVSNGDVTEGGSASFTLSANPAPHAPLSVSVSVSQSGDFGVTPGAQTVTIPTGGSYTLTVATSDDGVDEADGSVTATVGAGTGYTVSETAGAATVAVADDDDPPPPSTPVVSIAGGAGITEGGNASFTLTANPAPHAPLSVSVAVAQTGDYGVTPGPQTVSIPTSGSATLTVATSDDSVDEADGSVTATVGAGTGYTVSETAGAATVAVADDDVPEISITAGSGITEGGDASFTITANPAPHAPLSVSVSVSQSGDFGVTPGSQTVSIPTAGSATLTVATVNDGVDEADGSVTATVSSGSGYTVSSTAGSAAVAVADDDDPPPPDATPSLSISDGSAREDAGVMEFTVTLSAPSDKKVLVMAATTYFRYKTATVGDDFEAARFPLTFAPGETSKTVQVVILDDDLSEGDESFGLYLAYTPTNTPIAREHGEGVIIDDD